MYLLEQAVLHSRYLGEDRHTYICRYVGRYLHAYLLIVIRILLSAFLPSQFVANLLCS